jgi:hypothetical protein
MTLVSAGGRHRSRIQTPLLLPETGPLDSDYNSSSISMSHTLALSVIVGTFCSEQEAQ